MPVQKVVSGGQTGVDRAALDAASQLGITRGGWCPKGRRAEDGTIPQSYPLLETPSDEYAQRTEWNVRDSDGTLILVVGNPTGGTAHTMECAHNAHRPCLVVDLTGSTDVSAISDWLNEQRIEVLNVAGPRESTAPGIYAKARDVILQLFGGEGSSARSRR